MNMRSWLCIGPAILVAACNATTGGGMVGSAPQSPESGARVAAGGQTTLSGTVQRVWEDGFRLNTGTRAMNVDTWDVFGDDTRSRVRVGERVRVSGEMSGGEFDATSVSVVGGETASAATPSGSGASRAPGTE